MGAGPGAIAPIDQLRIGSLAGRPQVLPDVNIVAPLAQSVAAGVQLHFDVAEIDFLDGVALMAGQHDGAHERRILADDRIARGVNIDPGAADAGPAINHLPGDQRLLDGRGLRLDAGRGLRLIAAGERLRQRPDDEAADHRDRDRGQNAGQRYGGDGGNDWRH